MAQTIVQPLRRWDPERIGPYAIIGKLGAGAMGQVFLARSAAGRLVAVKTIRIELAEEPGFRARFAREVAAASRVSGVFTAAVIEADADADRPWVATAYVPAPSLRTLVRQCGPLPVPAVRWLAAGCAEALQSIHGAGLLHRDVKPSNVLVAPDGPRVIDFGVARAAERVQLTTTRGAAGTPSYMAPEQARDAAAASPASDVFSLGATLMYAATGHPPYQGETVMDVLVRLATEPPDLDGLPDELAGLVGACLERVPRDRLSDTAILAALGPFEHLAAGPGHSYLPGPVMTLIGEYQRSPGRPPGGAGLADADDDGRGDDEDDDPLGSRTDGSGAAAASLPSAAGDATSGSHTALPGFESPAAFSGGQGSAGHRARWAARPLSAGRPGGRRASGRRPLTWAGWAAAAVALVAAGTWLGMALRPSGGRPDGPPPSSGAPPALCTMAQPASTDPQVCVSQPMGDSDTVFVLHGTGFPKFTAVTIELLGVGTSADHPLADFQGTFNYAIDQGHLFFPHEKIPAGDYTVMATAANGHSATATFTVNSLQGPPPGGAPPPA